MVTITDIAKRLGVSNATISNALTGKGRMRDEKRKMIVGVAYEMGYDFSKINQSLGKHSICVITEQVGISFSDFIVNGITRAAQDYGYHVPIYNMALLRDGGAPDPDASVVREKVSRLLDGVDPSTIGLIYVSQYPRDISGALPTLPYPVVCAFCYTEESLPCVNYDDQQGAYLATNHLIEQGRRNIAMISGAIDSIPMTKRMSGYQRALIGAGIGFNISLMKIGDWSVESGYKNMQELLAGSVMPDAVFCQSDHIAIGAMRAIREAQLKIPQDVAVIGFDNQNFDELLDPPLSSIIPPFSEIGYTAFEKIVAIINRRDNAAQSVKINCTLAQRETV